MANETILVVDADTKSQKVLEVSFKKAGYRVLITDSIERAHEVLAEQSPDLIVSDTQLPDGDGFEFCRTVNEHPEWGSIPFVFLTEQRSLPEKMRGFELGADEYLTKPIYIKEATNCVEVLLQKKAQERLGGGEAESFEGQLADVTMIDLLQTIEQQSRSGSVQLHSGGRKGAVYFRQGNILDAMCGKLQGEEALYRLMLWPDGDFRVEYHEDVSRADHIEKDSGELLIEGIQRLQKWNQLVDHLPALGSVFEADYKRLPELLDEMPEQAGRVVRLFDGMRSLREVIDDSPFDDITTLQIIRRLFDQDVLLAVDVGDASSTRDDAGLPQSNLAAWLAGAEEDDSVPTPFSQVDSSAKIEPLGSREEDASLSDEAISEARGRSATGPHEAGAGPHHGEEGGEDGEGGGHWKVHWDGEGERPKRDTLEEIDSAAQESADGHIEDAGSEDTGSEEGGAEDDGLKELEQREVRRREEEAKQLLRQSGRFEAASRTSKDEQSIDPVLADGGSEIKQPRRKTKPMVEAVSRDVKVEQDDHEQRGREGERDADGFWRGRTSTPVTTPVAAVDGERKRSPADETSPGIQVARLYQSEDEQDEQEEQSSTADQPQGDQPAADQPQDDQPEDDMRSSAERRAAAVEEAASVQREATRSVRESAPYPAVDVDAETEAEDEAADEVVVEAEADTSADESVDELESEPDEAPLPEAHMDVDQPERVTEEISAVEEEEPVERVGEEITAVQEDDLEEVAVELPPGVERSATDRQIVKAEYDLSKAKPSGKAANETKEPAEAEEPVGSEEFVEARTPIEASMAASEDKAAEPEEPKEPAEEPEKAEKAEEAEEAEEPKEKEEEPEEDKQEAKEPAEEPEEQEKQEEPEEEEEPAAQEEPEEEEEPAAQEEPEEEEEPEEPALADESHEESFFTDGEGGDYNWEFEDVPQTSNRWMYFTALAVLAALTAVAIAIFDGDDPAVEEPAEEGIAAVDESVDEPDEPDEPAQEELAEAPKEEPEPPAGINADEATLFADESAGGVRFTARRTALVMTGVDPITAEQRAMQDPDEAELPEEGALEEGEEPAQGDPQAPQDQATASANDTQPTEQPEQPEKVEKAEKPEEKPAAPKVSPGKKAYQQGQTAMNRGNNSEAVKHLTRADELGYRKASMYLDLATAHQLMGDVGSAKAAYQKFLDMQPSGKRADEVRSILERL